MVPICFIPLKFKLNLFVNIRPYWLGSEDCWEISRHSKEDFGREVYSKRQTNDSSEGTNILIRAII